VVNIKDGASQSLPCYNCGHALEDHRMVYKKFSLFSPQEWECMQNFCTCPEWDEMDNLKYTAWKKYGNLLFLMRKHGRI
jgi:hypothetical protein